MWALMSAIAFSTIFKSRSASIELKMLILPSPRPGIQPAFCVVDRYESCPVTLAAFFQSFTRWNYHPDRPVVSVPAVVAEDVEFFVHVILSGTDHLRSQYPL